MRKVASNIVRRFQENMLYKLAWEPPTPLEQGRIPTDEERREAEKMMQMQEYARQWQNRPRGFMEPTRQQEERIMKKKYGNLMPPAPQYPAYPVETGVTPAKNSAPSTSNDNRPFRIPQSMLNRRKSIMER